MLEYDEWVVPGEVEYAEKKAAEIELQIQKWHKDFLKNETWKRRDVSFHIQITEHVAGEFWIALPDSVWLYEADIDISEAMILDCYRDMVAPVEDPKIFDIPADDIRSQLPEWNNSLISDDIRRNIMEKHSIRYRAARAAEDMNGDYYYIQREFKLSDAKCSRIMDTFIKKLKTENKPVPFTELEKKIGRFLMPYYNHHSYYYEPWYFPLAMSDKDILDAVCEAYRNAGKRSRRIIPDKFDYVSIDGWSWSPTYYDRQSIYIKSYECLYQGRAGELLIRFLFNYKDMKIMIAYPVLKEKMIPTGMEYHYYDKKTKCFEWKYYWG